MIESTNRPPNGLLVERYARGDYVRHDDHSRRFWAAVREARGEGPKAPIATGPTVAEAVACIAHGPAQRPTVEELRAQQRAVEASFTGRRQDADGWITPEFDAWCREHNPQAYEGLPTVGELRQELRRIERDPSQDASATTTLSAAEIVALQTGAT